MYFISYTMLHNPQTNEKYFKNIFKFKNLFKSYFRPYRSTDRSTVSVSGQNVWPDGRSGLLGCRHARCARLSVDRVGRPSTPAVDWPVDRLHGTCSLFVPVDRAIDRSQQLFLPSGLPVDLQLSRLAPTALFWICFFYGFQRLFLVSKWLNSPLMT